MPLPPAIIIGADICGVATALALTKQNSIKFSIYEIGFEPASLGVVHRLLPIGYGAKCRNIHSHRTGRKLGKIDFNNAETSKYHALRTLRDTLLHAMLEMLKEAGIHLTSKIKMNSVTEGEDSIKAVFEDGTANEGNRLLSCNLIHSAVRTKFVEPSRIREYTGLACVYTLLGVEDNLRQTFRVDSSSLYIGRSGLLCTYANAKRPHLLITATMETGYVGSREVWALWGEDQNPTIKEILARVWPRLLFYEKLQERVQTATMYSIYRRFKNGRWFRNCIMLHGDAAHAASTHATLKAYNGHSDATAENASH